MSPAPAVGGGAEPEPEPAMAALPLSGGGVFMVPGYILPFVNATPAGPCQAGPLQNAGFQMVPTAIGQLPAISVAELLAQGRTRQLELYTAAGQRGLAPGLVEARRTETLAVAAAVGASQPEPPQQPQGPSPQGPAAGTLAGGSAGVGTAEEVEYIHYTLRRTNLAYQPRSGMRGRFASPEELAGGSVQWAEARMQNLCAAIQDPGTATGCGVVVGWGRVTFGKIAIWVGRSGRSLGRSLGGRLGRSLGRALGGRWVGKVAAGCG